VVPLKEDKVTLLNISLFATLFSKETIQENQFILLDNLAHNVLVVIVATLDMDLYVTLTENLSSNNLDLSLYH